MFFLSLIPSSFAESNESALNCLANKSHVADVEGTLLANKKALENVRNNLLLEQKKLNSVQRELSSAKKALVTTAKGSRARTTAAALVTALSTSVAESKGKVSVMVNSINSLNSNGKRIAIGLSNARAVLTTANC